MKILTDLSYGPSSLLPAGEAVGIIMSISMNKLKIFGTIMIARG